MLRIAYLTPSLAVAGQLAPEDFAEIARQGFRTVINNRPDGEEPGQISAREGAVQAWRTGLVYRYVPAAKHEVLDDHVLDPLSEALRRAAGPVLLHCRSGMRSTIMWAALAVRAGASVEEAIAAAKAAGQDLEAVREEIAEQAARSRRAPVAACADCQAAA